MRLMARGLSRSAASPIRLQEVDLATPRSRASIAMGMIPIFLLVAAFIGGMNVAIDVTAGERERGSLEPLLLTYVPARAVVIGKWLASAAFSLLGLAVCLAGSMAILRFVEMRILGLRAAIEPREALWMFLTVTPLALLAAAAQMLLSTSSRSFKEAQTYVSILIFLPMLPGFLLQFQSLEREGWMGLVPLFGHQILLDDLLKGSVDTAAAVSALGCTLLTLAGAGICLGVNTRLLRSERIIHGR
jgi:sodium transport system permease protein